MSEIKDFSNKDSEIIDAEGATAFDSKGDTAPVSAEPAPKPFAEALDWVASMIYAVLIMLALNLFVFRSITVEGESMNNTLQDMDRIIASNFLYTPERGDIVVLQSDFLQPAFNKPFGESIIKRVIAVEGDTIKFDFTTGDVFLNGEKLVEDYIAQPTMTPLNCVSGHEYTVPKGHVFVMGDNRNRSTDSRDFRLGMVDTDYIMGKAVFRFAPFDSMGLI